MKKYQVDWPELLKCDNFPSLDQLPCLHFDQTKEENVPISTSEVPVYPTISDSKEPPWTPSQTEVLQFNTTSPSTTSSAKEQCSCHCHHPMIAVTNPKDPLHNKVRWMESIYLNLIVETACCSWLLMWRIITQIRSHESETKIE